MTFRGGVWLRGFLAAGLNAPFGARCFVTLKEQMRDVADHIRS